MVDYRIVDRPAFAVIGRRTWISGPDNDLFGRFWAQCQAEGLFDTFKQINHMKPGPQTGGVTLGISCVENDPSNREFYYLIAIEKPEGFQSDDLENYHVPAGRWAVFECNGKVPESIVQAEMFAFAEWLPASEYIHAKAPEMEIYPPESNGQSEDNYCEFWLPIQSR